MTKQHSIEQLDPTKEIPLVGKLEDYQNFCQFEWHKTTHLGEDTLEEDALEEDIPEEGHPEGDPQEEYGDHHQDQPLPQSPTMANLWEKLPPSMTAIGTTPNSSSTNGIYIGVSITTTPL